MRRASPGARSITTSPASASCSRAVYEQIESEIARQLGDAVAPGAGPLETLAAGRRCSSTTASSPRCSGSCCSTRRRCSAGSSGARSAPATALGLITGLLTAGMEAGEIRRQPIDPLAHALLGALDEVAMLVARADDPVAARAEAGETLAGLVEGLRA